MPLNASVPSTARYPGIGGGPHGDFGYENNGSCRWFGSIPAEITVATSMTSSLSAPAA